jgi:hypothetical protein
MKNIAIDLKASDKGQRKEVVKFLRLNGYPVIKRKEDPCQHKKYIIWRSFYDRFEYFRGNSNPRTLTLKKNYGGDWPKLFELVYKEKGKVSIPGCIQLPEPPPLEVGRIFYDDTKKQLMRVGENEESVPVQEPEWNYPCYGRHKNGRIVRFIKHGKGFVVEQGDGQYGIGYSEGFWTMRYYTPVKATFT